MTDNASRDYDHCFRPKAAWRAAAVAQPLFVVSLLAVYVALYLRNVRIYPEGILDMWSLSAPMTVVLLALSLFWRTLLAAVPVLLVILLVRAVPRIVDFCTYTISLGEDGIRAANHRGEASIPYKNIRSIVVCYSPPGLSMDIAGDGGGREVMIPCPRFDRGGERLAAALAARVARFHGSDLSNGSA